MGSKAELKNRADNSVANKLLVKQLQKYDIDVVATVNGSEAVREWESRPIGFFNFALFDHRECRSLLITLLLRL